MKSNKYKRALNNLKRGYGILLGLLDKDVDESIEKAFKVLDELVEKEKPQKLERYADGYDEEGNEVYDMSVCPECHREFEADYTEHFNYCPNCGQKLDWSEVEKEREEEEEEI